MINDRVIQSPFAWYSNSIYLEQFSSACASNGCPLFLFAPSDRLLPFQIRIAKSGAPLVLNSLQITVNCQSNIMDISDNLSDIEIESDDLYYYVIYKGTAQMEFNTGSGLVPLELPEGIYNAKLVTNKGTFYSESFCTKSTEELQAYYKVEWWQQCDVAEGSPVMYSTGYKNLVYLDADLLAPKLEIEEDSEKDGLGNAIPVLQRFIHRYRISTVAQLQSVVMALCTIPMHTSNLITFPDARSTEMKLVKPDPAFQECGGLLVLEFQEVTIIKSACCS